MQLRSAYDAVKFFFTVTHVLYVRAGNLHDLPLFLSLNSLPESDCEQQGDASKVNHQQDPRLGREECMQATPMIDLDDQRLREGRTMCKAEVILKSFNRVCTSGKGYSTS